MTTDDNFHDANWTVGRVEPPGVNSEFGQPGDKRAVEFEDFSKLTVGQLARKLEEMTRLVTSLGAQIQSLKDTELAGQIATEIGTDGWGDETARGTETDDLKNLASMLARLDAGRGI